MNSLFGEKLTNKNGDSISTSDALSGKIVGIYFSAHWCPPCRTFTPELSEIYNRIKHDSGKPFEIVFVSSDKDENSFKDYLSEMPWLALPFADRGRKNDLSKKYKVRGIPTLVIIDSADGETITQKGREYVTSNPDDFPWKPRPIPAILGNTFRKPDGSSVDASALEGKVLGLYFSAHWCPPCRRFTPQFGEVYNRLKEKGKEFEVVFVSSDRSEEEFKEYHNSQPWLALPFSERSAKEELSTIFDVDGIPSLIILDEKRNVINPSARSAISNVDNFPWHPKAVKDFNEEPDDINDFACLVALLEGCDDDEQKDVLELLEQVEKEYRSAGSEIKFYYVKTNDGGASQQLRLLTKLGTPQPFGQMVMLDIPDRGGYYLSDADEVTKESIDEFIDQYKSGAVERKQLG